ncbi:MAG: hypothetical protein ACRD1H_03245, partial [Vicinamibacterales bacterium]
SASAPRMKARRRQALRRAARAARSRRCCRACLVVGFTIAVVLAPSTPSLAARHAGAQGLPEAGSMLAGVRGTQS